MRLELRGHSRYSAAEQALFNYFGRREEGEALSSLHFGSKWLTGTTRLTVDGKTSIGRARAPAGSGGEDYCIKQSFYRAALPFLPDPPPWGSLTGIRPAKLAARLLDGGADAKAVLRSKYHVSPERAELAEECARASVTAQESLGPKDISLYVGIPFCPTRCAYCSFVSNSVEKSGKLIEPYVDMLCEEIALAGEKVSRLGLRVVSLYIGGGTPTTLSAEQLDSLTGALELGFDLSCLREYTVEAGRPDTITAEKLAVLRSRGVNRISVNPQTMEDKILEAIGRRHTSAQTVEAFAAVRAAGFGCVNMDLIAGLPGDTPEGFSRSLERILSLAPENITVHTLCLKKGAHLEEELDKFGHGAARMLDYASVALRGGGYEPYYLYRQKFMAESLENTGWRRVGSPDGLYNLCMMEELHTVLSLGAGGVTKLVNRETGLIKRAFHPKFPLEYLSGRDKILRNLQTLEEWSRASVPHP